MELNIGGTEWITIVFVALVLILGTGKLPDVARKIGRASAEFRHARDEFSSQMGAGKSINVAGPVSDERQKLDYIAKSMGIKSEGLNIEQLRQAVDERMGKSK